MTQTPDDLIEVGTYANEFAAGVIRAKLEEAGIPAQVFAAKQALIGVFGMSGWTPSTVCVRRMDGDAAVAILQAVRAEQGSVDWDAEDVGQPDPSDRTALEIASGVRHGYGKHARLGIAGGMLIASVIVPYWPLKAVLLLGASLLALPVLFGWKRKPAE